jgi:Xaa-Pro aminopeptidase
MSIFLLVKALPDGRIAEGNGIIEELRMIKTPAEQDLVRGSAWRADLSSQG